MPIPRLHQDIIDVIVDELYFGTFGNHKLLTSCATVSRAFRDPCQRHIFTYVHICVDPAPIAPHRHAIAEFREIFSINPRLCKFVRDLYIEGLYNAPLDEDLSDVLSLFPSMNSLSLRGPADCRSLSGILSRDSPASPGLHTFSDLWKPPSCWGTLGMGLRLNVLNAARSSNLSGLSIIDLPGFPLSWLSQCPNLRSLQIRAYMLNPDNQAEDSDSLPPQTGGIIKGSLKHLIVSEANVLPRLLESFSGAPSLLDLNHLHTYHIDIWPQSNVAPFELVIDASRRSMQKIDIVFHSDSNHVIRFGSLPSLTSLTFHMPEITRISPDPTVVLAAFQSSEVLRSICQMIETLDLASRLKLVRIQLDTKAAACAQETDESWSRIDVFLAKLQCLETATIAVPRNMPHREEVMVALTNKLPTLASKGLLEMFRPTPPLPCSLFAPADARERAAPMNALA